MVFAEQKNKENETSKDIIMQQDTVNGITDNDIDKNYEELLSLIKS